MLAINKPAGATSFDVIRQVRRIVSERRIGHAGTLDPAATGLLPLCVGRTTRLVDYFHAQSKTYHCRVRFGVTSPTLDLESATSFRADASALTAAEVEAALINFQGEIEQVPPMHSAVHHEGKRLYDLARAGKTVDRPPRKATIHKISLLSFTPGKEAEVELEIVTGKGTYVRVLASDLGELLGYGAVLSWLERTAYGALSLSDALTIEELAALPDPRSALLPPETAVLFLPRVDLAPQLATQLLNGQQVWLPRGLLAGDGPCRIHNYSGTLIALGGAKGGLLRAEKVLSNEQ